MSTTRTSARLSSCGQRTLPTSSSTSPSPAPMRSQYELGWLVGGAVRVREELAAVRSSDALVGADGAGM